MRLFTNPISTFLDGLFAAIRFTGFVLLTASRDNKDPYTNYLARV